MRSDFLDFDLPPHLIAQDPSAQRDQSRLLVVRRKEEHIEHRIFADLPTLLSSGDLLVLNDTRVLPARLIGKRSSTGGKWEGLFLGEPAPGTWDIICQTRGRLKEGEIIDIDPAPLHLRLVQKTAEGHWLAAPECEESTAEILEKHGRVPLPPYIRKGISKEADRERYQTIYARRAGAVAAPTAGLHFTPSLFAQLQSKGIGCTYLTLHVGLGTFQPIQAENVQEHGMHKEWCELPESAVQAIAQCRQRGGRVVAVGTTSARVLESVSASGPLRSWSGETDLYIYPPYPFRVVDALLTNFHLPRTTLLLLVGAFAGIELMRRAYKTAIEHEYRFFSYGDAMLIL